MIQTMQMYVCFAYAIAMIGCRLLSESNDFKCDQANVTITKQNKWPFSDKIRISF